MNIKKNFIADSCFWIALFDATDQFHKNAVDIKEKILLEEQSILLPWPSLFEILNNRFMTEKSIHWREFFKKGFKNNFILVDDGKYQDSALNSVLGQKDLSLVDKVVNLMMEDIDLKIKALITFNVRDFEKTARKYSIEIISK